MPKSANSQAALQTDNGNGQKRTNPFIKKLTVEMLTNSYVDPNTLKVDPTFNRDFVLEKIRRSTIAPLEGITCEQWLELANDAYRWHLDSAKRDKELEADAILNKAMADPDVWASVKRRLAEIEDPQPKGSAKIKETALIK